MQKSRKLLFPQLGTAKTLSRKPQKAKKKWQKLPKNLKSPLCSQSCWFLVKFEGGKRIKESHIVPRVFQKCQTVSKTLLDMYWENLPSAEK